ncbi:hypothetical protein GCM10008995_04810 [Halobellus salinus]|uniref:Uncharacterized protein n=1 Tax=Halobellus salinus TaxID=931585 RepID=A0A830EPP3_9EURY|nr:helix-turn-helix domain-containing protein [Halobellus salinus]GGI97966.1 hypothetical protein GCM10008995_04810 [Halobellus salinus]SMP06767.1 hypothetical protein SAMN06265347_102198 [Halobellus salinus]
MPDVETERKIPSSVRLMWHETHNRLERLLSRESPVVLKAAPGTGKTTAQFQVAYNHDRQITVLAARHDMYDDAKEKALDAGFAEDEIATSSTPHEDCPTFRGDHGDATAEEWRLLYRLGVSPWLLHERFNAPCQPDCPYMANRIENPDQYDVIICHYVNARDTQKIEDRLVFIDEFPSSAFLTSFGTHNDDGLSISEALDGYFDATDSLPWDNYGDFISNLNGERRSRIAFDMEQDGLDVDDKTLAELDESDRYHKMAPVVVFALLLAEDLGNGWHYWEANPPQSLYVNSFRKGCSGPEGVVVVRKQASSPKDEEVHILSRPDLSAADQIIGLDGTARKPLWDSIFQHEFEVEEYHTGEKMLDYVTEVQDIKLVATGDGTKPYSSGNHVATEVDPTVSLWTRVNHGRPVLIIPKKAGMRLKQTEPEMFENDLKPALSGDYEFMTFGMLVSNNDAAGTNALHVCGSTHPGDGVIKRWAALMGEGVERKKGTKGTDLVYEPQQIGDVLHRYFVHDQITQAILRGRKKHPDDDGAVVVVNTEAVPEWFEPDERLRVAQDSPFRSKDRRQFVRYLLDKGTAETTDFENEFDVHSTTVQRAMSDLEEIGWVELTDRPGPHPTLYEWKGE